MNLQRFITVENLCLAAEVTAALLLIAFAIPDRKKPAAAPSSADESESLKHLETARRAHCQATLYRGIAALAKRCTDDPAAGRFELYAPLALLGWEDRLTKLANRSFLDTFLEQWLSLPESSRQGSLLTMIVVDKYSDLLREQGAMGVEQSLRDLGEKIAKHYPPTSIIGRYQPDRFLVLQFDRSLIEAHEDFESLNNSSSDAAEASANPRPCIQCVASIVELGEEGKTLTNSLDKLDDGVAQAIEMGSSCVSEFEGTWTNKRPITDHARSVPRESVGDGIEEGAGMPQERRRLAPENPSAATTASQDTASASPAVVSENLASVESEPPAAPDSSASGASATPTATIPEPTDVSAVASSEDIAALFEQINKKKQESSNADGPKAPPPESAKPTLPVGDDDVVGADDIAALFAANAPVKKQEPEAKASLPSKPAANSDSKLNELLSNLHNDVTNDDLDSLFAKVQ